MKMEAEEYLVSRERGKKNFRTRKSAVYKQRGPDMPAWRAS